MRKISIALIAVLLATACSKEPVDLKQQSMVGSATADNAVITFPHYYFSAWSTSKPAGKISWIDAYAANAIKTSLEYDFNRVPTLSGAKQFVKWTASRQAAISVKIQNSIHPTIDMQDPCGIEGVCGGGNGAGDQSTFIIEFTFSSQNYGPDYTGYIVVTEDNTTHNIEEVTFHMDATGSGIYGSLTSEMATPQGYDNTKQWGTANSYTSDYPEPGSKYIVVDFHGTLNTALGIPGLPQMFASSKMRFEVSGRVSLDPHNYVTGGTVTRKPY